MDSNVNGSKVLHSKINFNSENSKNSSTPTTILSKQPQTQMTSEEILSQNKTNNKLTKTQTPMATNEMKIMTKIYEQLIEKQKLPKLPTGRLDKLTIKEPTHLKLLPLEPIPPTAVSQKVFKILPLEPTFPQNPDKMLPLEPNFLQKPQKIFPLEAITPPGFPQKSYKILPLEATFSQNSEKILPLEPTFLQKPQQMLPLETVIPPGFPQNSYKILSLEPTFLHNPQKILPLETTFLQKHQQILPLEPVALPGFPQNSYKILSLEPIFLQNPEKILPLEPTLLQKHQQILPLEPIATKKPEKILLLEPSLCKPKVSESNQQLRLNNINKENSALNSGIELATECPSLTSGENIFGTNAEDNLLQTVLNDFSVPPQIDSIKIECEKEEFISLDTKTVISNPNQKSSKYFQQCGIIQFFILDNSYCLTCFHCRSKYELWDWKKFVEHVEKKHKSLMISENKDILRNCNETRQFDSSGILKQHEAQNIYSLNEMNNDSEVMRQSEDKLCKSTSMLFDERNHNLAKQNISMPQNFFKISTPISLQVVSKENKEIDRVSVLNSDGEKSNQGKAVLNFQTDNSERIFTFLKVLRLHPLLWHTRRHGPDVWDQEAKIFLRDFDSLMSVIDLGSSLDNARNLYFNLKIGNLQLQNNTNLHEYGKILSEIVTLSKSYIFICKRCRLYFLDEGNLLIHQSLKHIKATCETQDATKQTKTVKIAGQELISCNYCQLSFVNKQTLINHIKEQHPDSIHQLLPYKCTKPECNERFQSTYLRRWHVLKHDPPRHHCEFCDKSYYTSFPLSEHRAIHLNQNIICEECEKCFVTNKSLKKHRRRMHNARKFHCQACNIHFVTDKNLIAHRERFHPNGTNLDRMKEIRKKMWIKKRMLRLKTDRSRKKPELKCRQCDQKFERLGQLIRHKQEFGHYLGQQRYKCRHCDSILSSAITFQRHLRDKHKILAKSSELKNYNKNYDKSEIYENEFELIVE